MDTKFSVAVHILILISEAPNPLNSDQMAGSVGTNASYIRTKFIFWTFIRTQMTNVW